MLFRAPNTFIQHWTAKELRAWWTEIKWRTHSPETWDIYKRTTVPTPEQVKAEFRRRRMKLKSNRDQT